MPVCSRCGLNKFAGGFNNRGPGLHAWCRECCTKYNRFRGRTDSAEDREAGEVRGRESEILRLIRRYEAVRFLPGPYRDAAYNALSLRLKQHARPVSDGVRQWSWDDGLGEITHRLIARTWQPPSDPHAAPCRMAKDDMRSYQDTVEFEALADAAGGG